MELAIWSGKMRVSILAALDRASRISNGKSKALGTTTTPGCLFSQRA